MINLTQLNTLGQRLKDHTALNDFVWCTTESDLSKKLHKKIQSDFPLLVMITPSFDSKGSSLDSIRDVASMIFFVLHNPNSTNLTDVMLIDRMDLCLAITEEIQDVLCNGFPDEQGCFVSNGIDPSSFHIDPETNFLGCHGWSMSFEFKS